MQVETRAYFAVQSKVMTADALTTGIGAPPSEVMIRGIRRKLPPLPVYSSWALASGLGHEIALWRHLEVLRELVAPLTGPIGKLCAGEPEAVLSIVREFRASDDEADLGFWLDREWLDILQRTGATLDVDEYDYS